jgi:AcrR family transcriptional regulator
MSGDVKRRSYRSVRRQEQAEETREKVLAAAASLFQERGYEGTTIAAIADTAGVSEETVYARFRNKRALIGELLTRAVRGSDPRPVPDQEGPQAFAVATDQREQLRILAADISVRLERAAPIFAVVSDAARAEPELAEVVARAHADRLANLRGAVDVLALNGPLRMSGKEAGETVWALTSPELHELLVRGRGWSRTRYRNWLSASLEALLL